MIQNMKHLVAISKLVLDFCRLASIEKPWRWNEVVTLSAKYRDLTANAQLALTVGFPLLYYLDKKWKYYLGRNIFLGKWFFILFNFLTLGYDSYFI